MLVINEIKIDIDPKNVKVSKNDHDYCLFIKDQLEKREIFDDFNILDKDSLESFNNLLKKYQIMCGIEKFVADNSNKIEIIEKFYNDLVRRINIRRESNGFNVSDKNTLSYKTYQSLIELKILCDIMLTKEKDDNILCNHSLINFFDNSNLDIKKTV